ncbi:hypothetical protein ETU08_09695 [Apibacter muscae]|uniref:hypothetical protein n=1 Tax=Apibacter muscae TaxID=2509004 RepID=UPI0011ACC070|nr:hypothetical protein [Apibacter muscae]TWP27980.1 hypothetical protein ETU08_09695 [Apibacter muscae]
MRINIYAYLLFILLIISCDNKNIKKEEFYVYGTSEFVEKEKGMKISLEEATQIYAEYIYHLQKNKKDTINCNLDIIYKDYYIFSPFLYNAKTGNYNLSGIWVNGNTGQIKKIKTEKNLHIILKIPKNYYKKEIYLK